MGLSKVIGAAATILFVVSIYFKKTGRRLVTLFLLVNSLLAYIVTIASHPAINFPLILGKNSDGCFPLWSKLLFGHFLIFVRLYVFMKRLTRNEPLYSEVSEGLYVGGWPSCLKHLPPGGPAVIDCTCELPRRSFISKDDYLCIATWDTRAPRPSQIEYAVNWACKKRDQKKPIYIHCAFGHGRSVCVMSALLVALGLAENWKDGEKMIREKRPKIRMNVHHRKNLEEWTKFRHLSKGG